MAGADLTFHHVGVACLDVEAEARTLSMVGYRSENAAFVDPVQGVKGLFLTGPLPRLELLQPIDPAVEGVLTPWLRAGHKMYHLAYETHDLEDMIETLRRSRAKLVTEPVPAVAFQGRRIAFLMLPNGMLLELISIT
ncbi:MAG TPA: VOC family protein [Burkholderiales bacterium]|nr:VOC family protein [Burkholderiales bacterium]